MRDSGFPLKIGPNRVLNENNKRGTLVRHAVWDTVITYTNVPTIIKDSGLCENSTVKLYDKLKIGKYQLHEEVYDSHH